jgi:DHA3 family macrolide efflux protein-like MFS transporter
MKYQWTGMQIFTVIWFGQLVSLLGTAMTRFALILWAYKQTGTATTVALIGFAAVLPLVAISPVAGVVVDRFDRRKVMLITDFGAGIMTLGLFALFVAGGLRYWHVLVALGLSGAFEAFQHPAYTAASTMLMPKKYFARASGMRSVADSGGQLIAPFFAAWLLPVVGLGGVMLVDIVTFLIAVSTLAIVTVPHPEPVEDDTLDAGWLAQIHVGFRFIFARGGLLGLLLVMIGMNFADGLTYSSILPAMVLGKTGGSDVALATVQAALGIGTLIGGVIISVWGGPRRQIHGVLLFAALSFAFGDSQLGLGNSVWRWCLGGFSASIFIPAIISANRTIWQRKTPPALQGRVFSVQSMLQMGSRPIGFLLAGPLADQVFGPRLVEGGTLAPLFGQWVGTGPGAGVALMFLGTAAFGATLSLSGYLFPAVRNVEDNLPDYDTDTLIESRDELVSETVIV